ncbi:hypothetical protein Acr_26g0006980 [Actinidia rufa]|uniref:Snurportin-1 n=1 Tax=Actinidia rufa TaxID=165716 RepID=A0A7J0H333_9ERIC|nr:hypothetical protein Acr_26g0006980 [Actinidia rufa]
MAPHEHRRPFKRPAISDQQKRRDLSLLRQAQNRQDAQRQARCLASTVLSFSEPTSDPEPSVELELVPDPDPEPEEQAGDLDVRYAAKLRGAEARRWFAAQLMLPEWMIDVPDRLIHDWYVFARPAGKRCFVVSSNGTTVSRLRNGSLLHRFPSALPSGARTKGNSCSAQSYCILDCIFNELSNTWMSRVDLVLLVCLHLLYQFERVLIARAFSWPRDDWHAHYQTGNTPLALVWKDENCSQYVIDTDSKGQVPHQQQVVLELQDDGKLTTSDDPHVVFGCLDMDFMQKCCGYCLSSFKNTDFFLPVDYGYVAFNFVSESGSVILTNQISGLQPKYLLRFAISDGGLTFVDGKLEKADLQYLGKANRARAFADSYSKVTFQYMARHSPLRIEDLLASISSSNDQDNGMEEMIDG